MTHASRAFIHIYDTREEWTTALADALVERARKALAAKSVAAKGTAASGAPGGANRGNAEGAFTLALTGGNTPRDLYTRLGTSPWRDAVDWRRVKIFFGDERAVPPDHDDSNFGMAWRTWLRDAPIPRESIFRMEGEDPNLAKAAERYETILEREVEKGPTGFPSLDVILLGLGPDGHIASLFPDTVALNETLRSVVANTVPRLNTRRLTFTYPLIESARAVWFLVTGPEKAATVARILEDGKGVEDLPAWAVRPVGGELHWWLDRPAASLLSQ